MKFRLNIRINEGVRCANYRDPRSRDRELRHKKKTWKKRQFSPWKVINPLIIPKPLDVRSWNLAQCGCLWMLYANRVWGRPVTWPKFYAPKMGKKVTSLNRYISVITDIDEKWCAVFEHAINRLSFGYVRLPQLENHFSCFRSFLLLFFFLFLLPLSTNLNR